MSVRKTLLSISSTYDFVTNFVTSYWSYLKIPFVLITNRLLNLITVLKMKCIMSLHRKLVFLQF